jgi:hypothetical protein
MGNEVSKLKHKLHHREDGAGAQLTSKSDSALPLPPQRLPTPEYTQDQSSTL